MLVLKSFFRKKSIKIYIIIIFFIFLIFNILFCYKMFLLNEFDNNYKDSYFVINYNDDIESDLNSSKYYIEKKDGDRYFIKCKHWYYMVDTYEELYEDIEKYNIEIEEYVADVDNSSITKLMTLYSFVIKVLFIMYFVVFIIIIWNIRSDIIDSNKLLKILGYSKGKIIFFNIVNIFLLNIIPLLINIVIYFGVNVFVI